jgi:hypothetical protein
MRPASIFFFLLLALVGISAAQDTTFPLGPQYLVTSNSPMFLRSIATPSLSLSAPPSSLNNPATEALPQPPSPTAGLPQPDLTRILWGEPKEVELKEAEPKVGEPEVSEPSVGENVGENVIEITSAEPPRPLPASILDPGVTGMTTAQSLREFGYGVPLAETAQFWKTHKPRAPRVFTNADVRHLHQS